MSNEHDWLREQILQLEDKLEENLDNRRVAARIRMRIDALREKLARSGGFFASNPPEDDDEYEDEDEEDEEEEGPFADYGWIIDKDYLYDPNSKWDQRDDHGTMGPRNIDPKIAKKLESSPKFGMRFNMSDDDGEKCYSGRLWIRKGESDEYAYQPLGDFGTPNAGCTLIKYPRRPHLDCG